MPDRKLNIIHMSLAEITPASYNPRRALKMFGYSFYLWQHEPAWLGWQHEPAFFGWKKGNKPPQDGDYSHALTTVWELDYDGKNRSTNTDHPTSKPVEIFAIPMRKHTQKGDVCLEPFSGSGSQIIAGERLGRKVYAIEKDPVFVDVAVTRWQAFTGKRAERKKNYIKTEALA